MTDTITRLSSFFKRFPGIGPRQAGRFVYFLLTQDRATLEYLARLVLDLKKEVHQCTECFRFYSLGDAGKCSICIEPSRAITQLMIVEKDADFETARRMDDYVGHYFILGGNVPILEEEPQKRIRLNELKRRIHRDKEHLTEIILALSATREGDYTARLLKEELETISNENNIRITSLGRGLSTGIEIEYTDPDTMAAALKNRS
ncbi:MAG: toprim domain-containing protein [bacterium]|nr:toprim domain-containing protein [bacterium]